jgi:adenine/guanine phosphoribosyltransferase-like PRPP-binding protein
MNGEKTSGGAYWIAQDPDELTTLIARTGIHRTDFKKWGCSDSSLRRAKTGVSEDTAKQIAKALNTSEVTGKAYTELFKYDPPGRSEMPDYSMHQVCEAAARVAEQIFEDFKPDVILTFPGHGSVITGLVCNKAPQVVFATPVYTAMLASTNCPTPTGFESVSTAPELEEEEYQIFVPEDVFDYKRVAVIDDVILTGEAMRALRSKFASHKGVEIRFACCVAHNRFKQRNTRSPEIVGIPNPTFKDSILWPWGRSGCFEDLPHLRHT